MSEMSGVWKWICEVQRRRRGHCTGLLEGSNRKDSLRECLMEFNLEFEISFSFLLIILPFLLFLSMYLILTFKVFMFWQNNSVEFLRLERSNLPTVVSGIEGEYGIEW